MPRTRRKSNRRKDWITIRVAGASDRRVSLIRVPEQDMRAMEQEQRRGKPYRLLRRMFHTHSAMEEMMDSELVKVIFTVPTIEERKASGSGWCVDVDGNEYVIARGVVWPPGVEIEEAMSIAAFEQLLDDIRRGYCDVGIRRVC